MTRESGGNTLTGSMMNQIAATGLDSTDSDRKKHLQLTRSRKRLITISEYDPKRKQICKDIF